MVRVVQGGLGYAAPISATALAGPGMGHWSPSGLSLGGVRVGLGNAAAQAESDALLRYGVGPAAQSHRPGVVKPRGGAHYLTEEDRARSLSGISDTVSGIYDYYKKTSAFTTYAAAILAVLLYLGKGRR